MRMVKGGFDLAGHLSYQYARVRDTGAEQGTYTTMFTQLNQDVGAKALPHGRT